MSPQSLEIGQKAHLTKRFGATEVAAFAALPPEGASSQPMDPGEAERRILDISGVAVGLPRDAAGFVVSTVERVTIRKRPAAGVRFRFEGGRYLLIVSRKENFFGGRPKASFPDDSLLSGERDDRSFVIWEREDASFIMVSDADVAQAFSLVRRFFT